MSAWAVSGYDLVDMDRVVFASVVNYEDHSRASTGKNWFLSVASTQMDMSDLSGTWWVSAEAAMEAVDGRVRSAA